MSDTPYLELRLSQSRELGFLNPFRTRPLRKKKRMHPVTLRLTDEQLASYKALGGAVGIRKMIDAAASIGEKTNG